MGQLRWDVATPATRAAQPHPGLQFTSYEKLWGLRSDWDYLTEENAPRCIERLPALIDETARMAASA